MTIRESLILIDDHNNFKKMGLRAYYITVSTGSYRRTQRWATQLKKKKASYECFAAFFGMRTHTLCIMSQSLTTAFSLLWYITIQSDHIMIFVSHPICKLNKLDQSLLIKIFCCQYYHPNILYIHYIWNHLLNANEFKKNYSKPCRCFEKVRVKIHQSRFSYRL